MKRYQETTMSFAPKLSVTIATLLAFTCGAAEAAQLRSAHKAGASSAASDSFAGGSTVRETCRESHPVDPENCDIDDFIARCDKAGGGLSSEPGGGINCEVNW
jgi:hypothetical protein